MTAVVRFTGVGRSYPGPPSMRALHGVNLTVRRGEYLTVIGRSGSGKSTLLNIMGLLDRPTEGTYELDGIDVGGLNETRRTAVRGQCIGFVFQAFHLLPYRTALDNVAVARMYSGARLRQRIEAAEVALTRVGLAHRMGAVAATLSGGEQQRVAIARAVAYVPSLLLCDEPTGNLDSETAAGVLAVLDELHAENMTLVVITHDHAVAARGQRTLTIRDGVLV